MSDSGDDEYELERILSDKVVNGETLYLVKWKGYGDEDCTWEPSANFSSPDSIRIWEEQKAIGDVLHPKLVAIVEKKIRGSTAYNHDQDPTEVSHNHSAKADVPLRKQQSTDEVGRTSIRNRKGIARKRELSKAPKLRIPERDSLSRSASGSRGLSRGEPRPVDSRKSVSALKNRQKLHNAQHTNNVLKRTQTESPPKSPAHLLETVADFQASPDTSHVLSPNNSVATRYSESPLFIPDPMDNFPMEALSPIASDSFPFPFAPAEFPSTEINDGGFVTKGETQAGLHDSTSQISPKNDDDFLAEARRRRAWKGREITCNFRIGTVIVEARLSHAPYDSFGCWLLTLDSERLPVLDFREIITRSQLDQFICGTKSPDAVGLVNPSSDQQHQFGTVVTQFVSEDVAAISRKSSMNISLVLYSCHAKSWKDLGMRPVRDDHTSLHIAFFPTESSKDDTEAISKSMQVTGQSASLKTLNISRTQDHTDTISQSSRASPNIESMASPDHLRTKRLSKIHVSDTVRIESGSSVINDQSDTATKASYSLSRNASYDRHSNSGIDIEPNQTSESPYARHTVESSKDHDLEKFRELTRPMKYNPKLRLDRGKSHFFISFAETHPMQADFVQSWLESMIPPSNIYLDSERHDWTRFREKAETTISVLLFHESHPNFHRLLGLDQVLMSELSICFIVNFGQNSTANSLGTATKFTRIFGKATIYLLTESMITQHLDDALSAVKYFDQSKRSDYRIMMRPKIEDWLVDFAAHETDKARRDKILDLLVLVRDLKIASPNSLGHPTNMYGVENSERIHYVLSCDSIPGYQESPLCMEAAARTMPVSLKTPATSAQERDRILREYFYGYTVAHAQEARRCIVFVTPHDLDDITKEKKARIASGTLDCGHIHFWDIQKFAARFR